MKHKRNLYVTMITLACLVCLIGLAQAEKYVVGSAQSASVPGQKSGGNGKSNSAQDTLIVEARLLELPGTPPPNDLYNYVYIMKYRVLKVKQGTYDKREILVGHYNPLIARDNITGDMDSLVHGNVQSFEVGDKHRLVLLKPLASVWDGAVEDDYFDSNEDKFYALAADNAE